MELCYILTEAVILFIIFSKTFGEKLLVNTQRLSGLFLS